MNELNSCQELFAIRVSKFLFNFFREISISHSKMVFENENFNHFRENFSKHPLSRNSNQISIKFENIFELSIFLAKIFEVNPFREFCLIKFVKKTPTFVEN